MDIVGHTFYPAITNENLGTNPHLLILVVAAICCNDCEV